MAFAQISRSSRVEIIAPAAHAHDGSQLVASVVCPSGCPCSVTPSRWGEGMSVPSGNDVSLMPMGSVIRSVM